MASPPLPPVATNVATDVAQAAQAGQKVKDAQSAVGGLLWAVVILSVATVVANVIVAVFVPDSVSIIVTISGVTVPILGGLIAAISRLTGQQNVSIATGVDGKVSQLIQARAEQQRAAGRADVIRQMMYNLQGLSPGSPEYETLHEQILHEQQSFFGVSEKRAGA